MDKIVVITGANSGIGKSAALKFAASGYRVIMACRNIETSTAICEEIKQKTKNSKIELFQLDVSSKKSIYNFCDIYKKKYNVLDILIYNAGHFKHGEKEFQKSVDGMERTFSTNLLGPVLMTRLLSDVLVKSDDPRVLNACSTNIKHFFHERRKIDFKSLSGQSIEGKRYNAYHLYGDSKIGLLMATFEMAQGYKNARICVNAIMIPATKIASETIKKIKSYWKFLAILQQPFVTKIDDVSNAYFSICTNSAYTGITGKLINYHEQIVKAANKSVSNFKIITSSQIYPPYVDDRETKTALWKICMDYH